MKVPAKDDPGGDKEGCLPQQRVLETLERFGVTVKPAGDGDFCLKAEQVLRVFSLPDPVGGLLVRRLARVFDIPVVEFYYPLLDPEDYH